MEKLELEHLTPYLPYKLKVWEGHKGDEENKVRTMNLGQGRSSNWVGINAVLKSHNGGFSFYRPILRPLSDLNTDEIFTDSAFCSEIIVQDLESIWMSYESPCMADFVNGYNQLLENHFDVFNLIEKGLAIDINTI